MEAAPKMSDETPSIPLSVIDTELEPINITPEFEVINDPTQKIEPLHIPKRTNQVEAKHMTADTPPLSASFNASFKPEFDDFGPKKIDHDSVKEDMKKRQKQQNRKITPSLLSSPLDSNFDTRVKREPEITYPDPSPLPPPELLQSTKSMYLEPPKHTTARPATSSSLATQTPLASLYLVSGLPKDPAAWTYADETSISSVHHSPNAVGRWWRAEALGTSASPGISIPGVDSTGKKKRVGGMPKNEVNKVLAKALKLSFTQEVEIISSSLQPPSTMHSFSFSVSTQQSNNGYAAHSINSQQSNSFKSAWANTQSSNGSKKYDSNSYYRQPDPLGLNDVQPGVDRDGRKTYHGVTLQVWSHADPTRAQAIRKALSTHPRRSESVSVASTSAKRDKVMQKRFGTGNMHGNGGADEASRIVASSYNSDNDEFDETLDEIATIGGTTDILSDVNDVLPNQLNAGLAHEDAPLTGEVPEETLFWLPYCLTLVSTHPIYDILADYLSISWAIFSRDISSHSAQMKRLLEMPAPKHGDIIKLPAAGPTHKHRRVTDEKDGKKRKEKKKKNESSLTIIARMPGAINFGQNLVETNFSMWPFFKALSIDNILTICEIALAPTGRVLFLSRHPQMLGVACLTLQYMVESRGWAGQVHQIVHARDYSILLEDPGQSIIGARTEVRYSLKPPAEVCVVDLDINFVQCINPPIGYVSTGNQREKLRRKLIASFGTFRPDESVPSEFKEAFPSGRFMPMCHIESKGKVPNTIEKVQAPYWWDPQSILGAFDSVLATRTKRPFSIMNLLSRSDKRKLPPLSQSEQKTQQAIRTRAAQFVDSRDELETKIGKLNKRLGFLVSKSEQWKSRFEQFESYAERLSAEASELRGKIDRERKESKRLSGMVIQQTKARDSLVNQLRQTEFLRAGALAELDVMQTQLRKLESERDEMVSHITTHISDAIVQLDIANVKTQSRSNSPWTDSDRRYSHQKSNSVESTIPEEDDYVEKLSNEDDHARALSPNGQATSIDGVSDIENSKSTYEVQKTMSMIQDKLEKALSDLEASKRQSMTEETAEPIQEDIKKTEIIQKDPNSGHSLRNIQRSQQFIRQSQLLQLAKDQEDHLAGLQTRGTKTMKENLPNGEVPSTTYARNSKRRSVHAPARLSLPPRNYHEFGDDEQKEFLFDNATAKDQAAEEYLKQKNQKKEFRKSLARLSSQQPGRPASSLSEDEKYMSSVESPEMLDKKELAAAPTRSNNPERKEHKNITTLRDGEKSEEEQVRNRSEALAFLEGSQN
ncbi:hypothetical protein E3Q11_02435 [Wallemia mellicola]|nr:hypothetical protein E3Q11_02435 [Wallemia mellicola]TIC39841.1 hypothetical protein E3Q07_02579 [Wallemia mellicola]